MPGFLKVRVVGARDLPVMDSRSDLTDAYVEVKLGDESFKTGVGRRTLSPVWNTDFRFELGDEELQDESLEIKVYDYDTISANDPIGKVYVSLNPLLTWDPPTQLSGWYPIYDTIRGVRGEVMLVIKLDLFNNTNQFRDTSVGVQIFSLTVLPEVYKTLAIYGFVEELVVDNDPEYHWADSFRTSRSSNEARQRQFIKLSNELQRKLGLKVLELGGNAVVGYQQSFDIEQEYGLVVRGIGTAVTLALPLSPAVTTNENKADDAINPTLKHKHSTSTQPDNGPDADRIGPSTFSSVLGVTSNDRVGNVGKNFDSGVRERETDMSGLGYMMEGRSDRDRAVDDETVVNGVRGDDDVMERVTKKDAQVEGNARPANTQYETGQAQTSMVTDNFENMPRSTNVDDIEDHSDSKSVENLTLPVATTVDKTPTATTVKVFTGGDIIRGQPTQQDIILLTLITLPPGVMVRLGGVVSARSVKLLDTIKRRDESEIRDSWWMEVREEIKAHAVSLGCSVVLAYREVSTIHDELFILSASGTACVMDTDVFNNFSLVDTDSIALIPATGVSSAVGVFNSTENRTTSAGVNASASTGDMLGRVALTDSITDNLGVGMTTGVGGGRGGDKLKRAHTTTGRLLTTASPILPDEGFHGNVGSSAGAGVGEGASASAGASAGAQASKTGSNTPNAYYKRTKHQRKSCAFLHIPYRRRELPFPLQLFRCGMCGKRSVPEFLVCTSEMPNNADVVGTGDLIEARVCRIKKKEKPEYSAVALSEALPFLEYDLHTQLLNKLKVKGMNAIFGLRMELSVGDDLIIAMAIGTAVYLQALPAPPAIQIERTLEIIDEEDKRLQHIATQIMRVSEMNRANLRKASAAPPSLLEAENSNPRGSTKNVTSTVENIEEDDTWSSANFNHKTVDNIETSDKDGEAQLVNNSLSHNTSLTVEDGTVAEPSADAKSCSIDLTTAPRHIRNSYLSPTTNRSGSGPNEIVPTNSYSIGSARSRSSTLDAEGNESCNVSSEANEWGATNISATKTNSWTSTTMASTTTLSHRQTVPSTTLPLPMTNSKYKDASGIEELIPGADREEVDDNWRKSSITGNFLEQESSSSSSSSDNTTTDDEEESALAPTGRGLTVVEVDDETDEDSMGVLLEPPMPHDIWMCTTQEVPGVLKDFETYSMNSVTALRRLVLDTQSEKHLNMRLASLFNSLLHGVCFKLRHSTPCCMAKIAYDIQISEEVDDAVQVCLTAAVLGLRPRIPHGDDTDTGAETARTERESHNRNVGYNLSNNHTPNDDMEHEGGEHMSKLHVDEFVEISALNQLPGTSIVRYCGPLNVVFIKESNSIREDGGISSFVHKFIAEAQGCVRAYVRTMGGNALLAFRQTELNITDSPHKDKGYVLVTISGDVFEVERNANIPHPYACGNISTA
eukprot:CFRG3295T1